ncbi:MAG: alpha/beta fold hydrolase [Longimicrobiales bacterium]
MNTRLQAPERVRRGQVQDPHAVLVSAMPASERRLNLAGIPTTVLIGGAGPSLVLLHGPGEFAAKWLRVFPDLVRTHRVIAPDLPCHGRSAGADDPPDVERALAWLRELIEQTCETPPVLLGHVLGGAIAARFAIRHGERLDQLVLVDSLGLAPFRPAPRFALAMMHFMARPNERTFDRFMRQCSYDLDELREQMGEWWEPFAAYQLENARGPSAKAAGRLMRSVGVPRIPPEDLARITVPTTLIWGRHDRALRLPIAQAASERYGWPLHVVDDCADDPPRDRPEAFLRALRSALREPRHSNR